MSSTEPGADVLILAPEPLPRRALGDLVLRYGETRATLVDFQADAAASAPSSNWKLIRSLELLDAEALRDDFLGFLDSWPRQALEGNRSFDEAFRHVGDYSVWWIGPGSSRQPTTGPLFPVLRTLWICARAIEQTSPRRVVLFTKNRKLAAMLASKCRRAGVELELARGSARPAGKPHRGQTVWLVGTLLALAVFPLWIAVRWLFARLAAGFPRESERERRIPSVVMTGWYPQHVRPGGDDLQVWYWRELAERLEQEHHVRARFLLHTSRFRFSGYRKALGLVYTGWRRLREIDRLAPLQQAQLCLGAYFRALPRQLAAIRRYRRLERSPAFRQSFDFAGADVAWLMIPALRHAVAGMAKWARNVEAVARSLASVGNVKAVLVHEELYQKGMLSIAAARKLGIPTVGVQHGTLSPDHLVYTIPPGHMEGAPTPDFFAVYGQYAKEVISGYGAYPAERVWITGGPRFDPLVLRPADGAAARARLDLPAEKFVVLVTTERYSWSSKPCAAVFTAARGMDDVLVCVKTHPGDAALDKYAALAEQCGATNVRFFRDRFDDLVAACDVLVSGSSTTMLEAMLCGKATICANFRDEPDRYPYVEEGGSLGARTLDEMIAALEQLRDGSATPRLNLARQRFLERHLGPTARGQAAATLAEMLSAQFLEQSPLSKCA